jgi:hypothetical protein
LRERSVSFGNNLFVRISSYPFRVLGLSFVMAFS